MNATETSTTDAELRRAPVGRRLAVTWQHPTSRQIAPVALLEFDGERYRFHYIRHAESVPGFRPLLGFPEMDRTYESEHLFPLFAQRVMDPRRPDFVRYVERLGLGADASPWEQMSRSGGTRQGDVLQLFPEPQVLVDGTVTCNVLVHGLRHVHVRPLVLNAQPVHVSSELLEERLQSLRGGDPLRLIRELDNPSNPLAVVAATQDDFPLGWVPDLFLNDLYAMSSNDPESVAVHVEQINGPEAPAHLRLLVRLTCADAQGYVPFTGPDWEPIA
jgi:hypothetical protein